MRRFKRYFRERWWTNRQEPEDARPYFESWVAFQAADMDEAELLQEAMLTAIGCTDETCGNDQQCPHFRIGSLKLLEDDE